MLNKVEDAAIGFLILLPNWLFVLFVKALAGLTRLCYFAANEEIQRGKPKNGLSKKHLMMLYEVYANTE